MWPGAMPWPGVTGVRFCLPLVLPLVVAGVATAGAASPSVVAAQSEMATLATQMELVAIDTTFYTTLENLNDLSTVPGDPNDHFDFINDGGGALVIVPSSGRFRSPARLDLLARPAGLQWQGPYVSIQPQNTDDENSDYDEGTPLDPWGNPYYFYTPLGLVAPKTQTITLDFYGDDFSQYTIVSHGPDGAKSADDLTRVVGSGGITQAAVSSVRIGPSSARTAAYQMRVKGYFFGATQGTGDVLVNGSPAGTIASWTNNLILVDVVALPPVGATITVNRNSGSPLAFTGYLVEGPSCIDDWTLY